MDDAHDPAFLDRTATIGDAIAWVFAVPTVTLGLLVCPYLVTVVGKFERMFQSLRAELPWITKLVLAHGPWLFTLVPLLAVAGMAWVLLRSRSGTMKLAAAVAANQVVMAIVAAGVLGILMPILEAQKRLS